MSGDSQDSGESRRETLELDDVFSVLGDETRIEILIQLAEIASEKGIGSGLGFSALQDRVGVTDSGRFNYHLDKLTGQFVAKADGEYVARWPALMLIAAIHAGLYGDTTAFESESAVTEFRCSECHDTLEVRFAEGTLGTGVYMHCEEHGRMDDYWFPPGAQSGRSLRDAMRVAYTRLLTNVRLARQGICMECWGRVSTDYPAGRPDGAPEGAMPQEEYTFVRFQCERCWNQLRVPLRTYIMTHAVVEAAFARRGYERLDATDMLTAERGVTCEEVVVSEQPPRRSVGITFDDETLVVSVDEECSVSDWRWD
jgi:DNA-binding transcriptional ArsR family regulator